ncbi:ABC transporter substrate-binding protein [Paenibacillus sp. L3-i20]|uniref:ABC transporter substrate-binding protein n=1 Tax=Paenibacillus sp. L3-i20 TaxID=2905833 RepID=UPI001EE1538B|nr:extracellular solute-binding protein [Paenibacillus sp. L3-i20]GKU76273.1 hypothetical protein L3i20_v206700 [Paenibacillus sp. L3-i20]
MKKLFKKAVPIVLLGTLLAGCSFGGSKEAKVPETSTLKVMYYDEGQFFQDYGMLFTALFPNIEVQVVSTQEIGRNNGEDPDFDAEKAKKEFIEKEKPDLIMMDINEYQKAAEEGRLHDLEAQMTKDKFNTEGIVPGMIDYMKELGGGKVYALPTAVNSQVMYFNKELFTKHNIEFPTDKMSWNDVIQLAKRFPTEGKPEERVYGLKVGYSGDLNELSTMVAGSEGLTYVNGKTKKMTIDTPGWETSVQTALDAIKSKALYVQDPNNNGMSGGDSYEDYLMRDPFISGRLAMTIDSSYYINQIEQAADYIKKEGVVVKDWDMVTVPVSAQLPDESSNAYYSNIFGIAKDSPNVDAAWKFISYISSEDYSRVKAKTPNYNGFPIHTKYVKDEEGRNLAAFYKLKPSKVNNYSDYEKLPPQFNQMFYGIMQEEFKSIQDGKKEIKEGLALLQVKGDELLAQAPMTDEEIQKEMEEKQKKEAEAAAGGAATEEATEESTTESGTVIK